MDLPEFPLSIFRKPKTTNQKKRNKAKAEIVTENHKQKQKQKKKRKRGFATKKEALGFERDFLEKQSANPDMTFQNLYEIYMEDMAARLKQSTLETKCQGLFSIPTIHCMRKATVDFTLQWLLSTYN